MKIDAESLPPYPQAVSDHIANNNIQAHRLAQALAILNANPAKIALYHDQKGYWYLLVQARVAGEKVIRHSLKGRSYVKEFPALVKRRNEQGLGPELKYKTPKVPTILKPYLRDNQALPVIPE